MTDNEPVTDSVEVRLAAALRKLVDYDDDLAVFLAARLAPLVVWKTDLEQQTGVFIGNKPVFVLKEDTE